MYATIITGHRPHTAVSKDQRTIQQMTVNNQVGKIIQSTTTTTEEWYGLSYADAMTVCTSSENLRGAKLTMTSGMVTSWCTVWGCYGTRVSSQLQRMSDTNLYHVIKTTQEMSVTGVGGTLEIV